MSRRHIEVKNGIWLLEKTMITDSPWLYNRWLHGLSNDQGMTDFADGHWEHKNEMLTGGAGLLVWPKRRSCYKLYGPALSLGTYLDQETQHHRLHCRKHVPSGLYSRLVLFISNQSLCPSGSWKNTEWESDQRTY